MTALQVSIGTLNDIVDAPRDRGAKPGKPIPAGLVSRQAAMRRRRHRWGTGPRPRRSVGPGAAVVLLGVAVLAIGYGYDLLFKGTAWSWLPFAVGIPLLPVYGWVGATGDVPASFAVLVPVAVVAGAGLAVANARADEVRDAGSGTASVATRLGSVWSWRVDAVLSVIVIGAAVATLLAAGAGPLPLAGATIAAVVVAIGLVIGRADDAGRRERAWELQAIGVAIWPRRGWQACRWRADQAPALLETQ